MDNQLTKCSRQALEKIVKNCLYIEDWVNNKDFLMNTADPISDILDDNKDAEQMEVPDDLINKTVASAQSIIMFAEAILDAVKWDKENGNS